MDNIDPFHPDGLPDEYDLRIKGESYSVTYPKGEPLYKYKGRFYVITEEGVKHLKKPSEER